MLRKSSTRVIAVALAAGSLMIVPLSGSAGAAGGALCSAGKQTTNLKTFKATQLLSNCTNAAATGGKGTLSANFKNLAGIAVTILFNKTGSVGPFVIKETTKKAYAKCKTSLVKGKAVHDDEAISTGIVKGGKGKAAALLKGTKFSQLLCIKPTLATYPVPGSKVAI